jgi:hypothetical protein
MTLRKLILGSLLGAAVVVPTVGQAARIVEYEVEIAPPPPRVEVVPAPRPGYIYEPGYWYYDGRQYTWVDGRFIVHREGHHYIPHVWEQRGARWVFRPGRWDDE